MAGELTTCTAVEPGGWARPGNWLRELLRRWRARPSRELRLCETLALGERRFLAVVEFGRRRFLIGGTSASVRLLARLPAASTEKDTEERFGPGREK